MTASWGPGSQISQLGETMGFSIHESLRTAVSNDAVFKRALNTSCDSPGAWHRAIRQRHPMSSFPLERMWLCIFSTDIPGLGLWALTETTACHFLPLTHSNNKSKFLLYHKSSAPSHLQDSAVKSGRSLQPPASPKSEGFVPHMQCPSFSGGHLRPALMGVLRTPGTTLNKEGSFQQAHDCSPQLLPHCGAQHRRNRPKAHYSVAPWKTFDCILS